MNRFDKETHSYFIDDIKVPCVSDVLDFKLGSIFDKVPKRNWAAIIAAEQFGKSAHTGINLMLSGRLDWKTVDDPLIPVLQSAQMFINHFGITFNKEDIEKPLYSKEFMFAGTPDLVGYYFINKIKFQVIIDWKTTTTIDEVRCGYQLAGGYDILDAENYHRETPCNKVVVQLNLKGGYKIYPIQKDYRRDFLSALKQLKEVA